MNNRSNKRKRLIVTDKSVIRDGSVIRITNISGKRAMLSKNGAISIRATISDKRMSEVLKVFSSNMKKMYNQEIKDIKKITSK